MARTIKNGLGYISLDCNFFDKEKMFLVEERFGEVGTLRALRLMLHLYETGGCFIEWGEGSAYYFAKKILNNADAADMTESLVSFLVEIGFFDSIQSDENGEGKTYLSSKEIVRDWLKIVQKGRLKINLEDIPHSVILAYYTQFAENKYFTSATQFNTMYKNETFNAINATFKPLNVTFKAIKTRERKENKINKQTNKQAKSDFAFIAENADETQGENSPDSPAEKPPFSAWVALADQTEPPPVFAAAREAVLNTVYFRGISRGLVDAAARCVSAGWLNKRGLRNIRRKAEDAVELFRDTQGRRGNANGWEVVRDCIALVIREHGYTPPDYSRLDPEPPPAKPAKAERMAAGV